MLSSATQLYRDTILPALDVPALLAPLKPRLRGGYYTLECPACGHAEAYLYKGSGSIVCNRKKECGAATSLWDYIAGREHLREPQEVLQFLAGQAGVALPDLSPQTLERLRVRREALSGRAWAWQQMTQALWGAEGEPVRSYLRGRGYSEAQLAAMPLGVFPKDLGARWAAAFPAQPFPETLQKPAYGRAYPLVLPWFDARGQITHFVFRAIQPGLAPKYLYEEGLKKSQPYLLHTAQHATELVLVEGVLDALLCMAEGLPGVLATGGAGLTAAQSENLPAGLPVTLAFDADEAGVEATRRSLRLLEGQGRNAFVLADFGGEKDPDGMITRQGIGAFREGLKRATPAPLWQFAQILGQHDLNTEKDTERALEAAIALYHRTESLLWRPRLLEQITGVFGLSEPQFHARIAATEEATRRRQAGEALAGLAQRLSQRAAENPESARQWALSTLQTEPAFSTAPALPAFSFDAALKRLRTLPQGFKTSFTELDRFLTIPRGAVGVVAAKSRHGKTTFLLNLLWRMVRQYPDYHFLYFTYEERKEWLALKLLNLAGGRLVDSARWMQQQQLLLEELRQHGTVRCAAAAAELEMLAASQRLQLIDAMHPAETLADVIVRESKIRPIGAVFVDYIQKVPLQAKTGRDQRYLELKGVSAALLNAAIGSNVALITGCQLNRESGDNIESIALDHVRESADITQDANWVLGLWNDAAETEMLQPESELQLRLLKNRDGQTGKTLSLPFHRPLLKLG